MKISREQARSVNLFIFCLMVIMGLVAGIVICYIGLPSIGITIINASSMVTSVDIIFGIMCFGFIGLIIGLIIGQGVEDRLWWKYGDYKKQQMKEVKVGQEYISKNPYDGEGRIIIVSIDDGEAKCLHVLHTKFKGFNGLIEYKPIEFIMDYYDLVQDEKQYSYSH